MQGCGYRGQPQVGEIPHLTEWYHNSLYRSHFAQYFIQNKTPLLVGGFMRPMYNCLPDFLLWNASLHFYQDTVLHHIVQETILGLGAIWGLLEIMQVSIFHAHLKISPFLPILIRCGMTYQVMVASPVIVIMVVLRIPSPFHIKYNTTPRSRFFTKSCCGC